MKYSNKVKRLRKRQSDYDRMVSSMTAGERAGYRRPGSVKKG